MVQLRKKGTSVYYGQKKLEAALVAESPVEALNAAFVAERSGEVTAIPSRATSKGHEKG